MLRLPGCSLVSTAAYVITISPERLSVHWKEFLESPTPKNGTSINETTKESVVLWVVTDPPALRFKSVHRTASRLWTDWCDS